MFMHVSLLSLTGTSIVIDTTTPEAAGQCIQLALLPYGKTRLNKHLGHAAVGNLYFIT